jgi:hypothetical protein
MNTDIQQEATDLFGSAALSLFKKGAVENLLVNRNRHLGSLLRAERALSYLNILYRMLLFKRDYELEPLYDDIYRGVEPAQSVTDDDYDQDRFRGDMAQLAEWDLVSFRIEKQRLRGYRDNRKRKFRYRLDAETVHFLEWLEQRLLDDIHSSGNDTRDLLGEMRGSLGELLRLLHHFQPQDDDAEEQKELSRRVLFQLFKAGDLSQEITAGLADFNGRLLFFLVKRYEINEVRQLVKEVESYVETFLKQASNLRLEILPLLERLQNKKQSEKLLLCHEVMEKERLRTPHLLQTRRDAHVEAIPGRLLSFFTEQGGLDRLLHRINRSSLPVWQKLRSHLRELERKNNKLQDIASRIDDIASFDENKTFHRFFNTLMAQPLCRFDLHYWDKHEKAEPPKPKKTITKKSSFPKQFLSSKRQSDTPVQSMDEAKLVLLHNWLHEKLCNADRPETRLSRGCFDCFADCENIINLAKAGILTNGKRLHRIHYSLSPKEEEIMMQIDECSLKCCEMLITATKWKE